VLAFDEEVVTIRSWGWRDD